MEALHANYQTHLDAIAKAIQDSEILSTYLEEEGDVEYKALIDAFEPSIHQLYEVVAANHPLQLESLEKAICVNDFEGLYLPRVIGYSVLRGQIDEEKVKYHRPQNHFKDILMFICQSSNFEQIQLRIGQAVQIGFALSSDIWITNIIESFTNKQVKTFLQTQKLHRFRDLKLRWTGLTKYRRQFHSLNYYTAEFPSNPTELKVELDLLKHFVMYRYNHKLENATLVPYITTMLQNESLQSQREMLELMIIFGLYIDLDADGKKAYATAFKNMDKNISDFSSMYFEVLRSHWEEQLEIDPVAEKRLSALIPRKVNTAIDEYYGLIDIVHGKGYVHEDAIEAVNAYYYMHEGRSDENFCVRSTILSYLRKFLNNLDEQSYTDYFDIYKIITLYINTFSNQRFNQSIKELSVSYVKRLLKVYIDKRGKDYQDIKKFVRATFLDLGFMKEKELTEFFKTKRKKKA